MAAKLGINIPIQIQVLSLLRNQKHSDCSHSVAAIHSNWWSSVIRHNNSLASIQPLKTGINPPMKIDNEAYFPQKPLLRCWHCKLLTATNSKTEVELQAFPISVLYTDNLQQYHLLYSSALQHLQKYTLWKTIISYHQIMPLKISFIYMTHCLERV